ncbi:hypothetical protein BGZ50_004542 [Haplosporangium sp. Z 11]|nr:hypothetical protein BGZ50_004542 [Haplosporangium sp. Z 11]
MDASSATSTEAKKNGQQVQAEAHEHSAENNIDDTVAERTDQQSNAMQHGKRHGHTSRAKTKLIAKSSSSTSHPHTYTGHATHHHQAAGAAKSEQRHKPAPKGRKRKTKFIVGDHEQDDVHLDVGVGAQGTEEEQRGQTNRRLEHDGHHSYHPTRHRHDPYPQKHQFHHQHHYQHKQQKGHQQHQHQLPEPHQVHIEARLEDQDRESDPTFESIPNSATRDHPRRLDELNSDGSLSIAPLMQNLAIDLKQPSMGCQVLSQRQQEQEHQQEHHQHQSRQPQDIDVPEDTIPPPPSTPKFTVLSSTGSNTTKNDTAVKAPSPLQLTSTSNTSDQSSPITPPQHQTSQRLSRLLNPSLSNTSLPSLCKINPHSVLTVASRDSHYDQADYDASSALSAQLKEQREQRLQSSSSAITFVTQFLNSPTMLGARSHSDSNLTETAATAGALSSRYSSRRSHLLRNGSNNSVTSVQSSPSYSNGHDRLQRPRSQHSMTTSPPRMSNGEPFVISRFLTPTANSGSPSTSAPKATRFGSSTSLSSASLAPPPPSSLWNRRLPASLRMTSTSFDSDSDRRQQQYGSPEALLATQSLASTSPSSDYSSPDGASVDRPDVAVVSLTGSTNSALTAKAPNPWNSVESMSRTQQKLNLQRASSQDDVSEEDLVRRGRILREVDRIQREYRCIRMTTNPMMESLWRCLQRQENAQTQAQDELVTEVNPLHGLFS